MTERLIQNNLGTNIKICSVNNTHDLILVSNLIKCIDDIYQNTKRYDGNLFSNMTIEVYENNYPNSPFNGNYAVGLASPWKNLIQLKSTSMQNLKDMSELLSHEFGHYKANKIGFDNPHNFIRHEWNRIRSIFANEKTPVGELIAEDIRYYEGSSLSKGYFRTNSQLPHANPDLVTGLNSFYKLWGTINTFVNSNFNLSLGSIKNIKWTYRKDFAEVEFEYHLFGLWSSSRYKINLLGIYKLNTFTGIYDLIKAL